MRTSAAFQCQEVDRASVLGFASPFTVAQRATSLSRR